MMDSWMGFGLGYGIAHWVIFAALVAVALYPVGRILNRIGFSPLWSVVVLFPFVNLLGLWVLAFCNWPRDRDKTR